jgi:transcriptional regulator GlxA family with amidase domain
MQLFDLTGPASVFAEASEVSNLAPYRIRVISTRGGVIRTSSGVELMSVPAKTLKGGAVDTIFMPGGASGALKAVTQDQALKRRIQLLLPRARRLCSVCTGAFVLAEWGMLDGHRVTTHWLATEQLARRYPAVKVDANALFVADKRLWTSAGVSTGIDMALALVEADFDSRTAANVARRLVLQARRPGHQSQFSEILDAQAGPYAELTNWINANLDKDLSVQALAARAGQSARTFHRRFTEIVRQTPAAFVERLRIDRARVLLEAGDTAKRAATLAGFGSLNRLERSFRRRLGLNPSAYQALHGDRQIEGKQSSRTVMAC